MKTETLFNIMILTFFTLLTFDLNIFICTLILINMYIINTLIKKEELELELVKINKN
jgi:hypothetical protein